MSGVEKELPSNKREGWDAIISNGICDRDAELIRRWSNGRYKIKDILEHARVKNHKSFDLNRLIFARAAEKFVIEFYSSFGVEVAKDISARQIECNDHSWRTHDLEISDLLLDVKNCTSYYETFISSEYPNRGNYISQMKAVDDKHVHIAGVITRTTRHWSDIDQIILGTVCRPDWIKTVDAVNSLPERSVKISMSFQREYIPPWSYELHPANPDFKLLYEITRSGLSMTKVLPLALAAGRIKEIPLNRIMNKHQQGVVERLNHVFDNSNYSKMAIVLFAFSEYMNFIVNGLNGAAVIRFIRRIVAYEHSFRNVNLTTMPSRRSPERASVHCMPESINHMPMRTDSSLHRIGGLYDPTESVEKLFRVLERLAENIRSSRVKFINFQANNPYILKGTTEERRVLVLYAHCGGYDDDGQACGKFPLIHFDNQNCHECGRLVCDDCGYCDNECKSGSERQADIQAKSVSERPAARLRRAIRPAH